MKKTRSEVSMQHDEGMEGAEPCTSVTMWEEMTRCLRKLLVRSVVQRGKVQGLMAVEGSWLGLETIILVVLERMYRIVQGGESRNQYDISM